LIQIVFDTNRIWPDLLLLHPAAHGLNHVPGQAVRLVAQLEDQRQRLKNRILWRAQIGFDGEHKSDLMEGTSWICGDYQPP
jgi:hypothetical protein